MNVKPGMVLVTSLFPMGRPAIVLLQMSSFSEEVIGFRIKLADLRHTHLFYLASPPYQAPSWWRRIWFPYKIVFHESTQVRVKMRAGSQPGLIVLVFLSAILAPRFEMGAEMTKLGCMHLHQLHVQVSRLEVFLFWSYLSWMMLGSREKQKNTSWDFHVAPSLNIVLLGFNVKLVRRKFTILLQTTGINLIHWRHLTWVACLLRFGTRGLGIGADL